MNYNKKAGKSTILQQAVLPDGTTSVYFLLAEERHLSKVVT
jgi:hypothetical protein